MAKSKLKLTDISVATTYRFGCVESGCDEWAVCTVNDKTNELSITSDWGNWNFMFGGAFGTEKDGSKVTLTSFIASAPIDYLAGKLCSSTRSFDPEKTLSSFLKELRRLKKDEYIRELMDDYGCYVRWVKSVINNWPTEAGFLDHIWEVKADGKPVFDEPWNLVVHSPSGEYISLTEIVLPAIISACKKTYKDRANLSSELKAATASILDAAKVRLVEAGPSGQE